MILELRKEEGWVDVGVTVVHLTVVHLSTACSPERRHSVRTSIFAQSSQRWCVGA